jgi:pimeloyl-ACP methyl ester carboxylesterase
MPELARVGITSDTVDLPFTSAADDVETVRTAIASTDGEVSVLGHSFGGAVISAAAAQDGVPYGNVASLIYLTAFMTAHEQIIDFSGAPGMAAILLDEATASVDPVAAESAFYHRCTAEDAHWAIAQLRPMPTSVLVAPLALSPAWQVVPSAYIVCDDDRILSTTAQEQMAVNADAIFRIDSDHSPFLSCPAALAAVLSEIIAVE